MAELYVNVEGGKYTFVCGEGAPRALRNGEPWVSFDQGSKAIVALVFELDAARVHIAELEKRAESAERRVEEAREIIQYLTCCLDEAECSGGLNSLTVTRGEYDAAKAWLEKTSPRHESGESRKSNERIHRSSSAGASPVGNSGAVSRGGADAGDGDSGDGHPKHSALDEPVRGERESGRREPGESLHREHRGEAGSVETSPRPAGDSEDECEQSGGRAPSLLDRAPAAPEAVTLRPVVRWFAEQMERKLRENDHKGGWLSSDPDWLFERAGEELDELGQASSQYATREAADVANMVMMYADLLGPKIGNKRAAPEAVTASSLDSDRAPPAPDPDEPPPERTGWRTGRKNKHTLYEQQGPEPSDGDRFVGVMLAAEDAERVVAAVNATTEQPEEEAKQPSETGFLKCAYCGCNTNAAQRACCKPGRDIDRVLRLRERDAEKIAAAESEAARLRGERDQLHAELEAARLHQKREEPAYRRKIARQRKELKELNRVLQKERAQQAAALRSELARYERNAKAAYERARAAELSRARAVVVAARRYYDADRTGNTATGTYRQHLFDALQREGGGS